MEKRYLTFFLLALPVYIGTMLYIQRQQERAAQQAPPPAALEATPEPPAQPIASAPAEPAAPEWPTIGPAGEGLRRGEGEPAAARRIDPNPEVVHTATFEVRFSRMGAVPIGWAIHDERFRLHRSKAQTSGADGEPVELIDPALDAEAGDRPLEVILKERQGRFYKELNAFEYAVSRSTGPAGETLLRFESPLTEAGLRLIKTYTLPQEGFECRLDLELANEGGSRLFFNEQGYGLGVALGPGLGRPTPNPGGGFGARYEYTSALYKTPETFVAVRLKPSAPAEVYSAAPIQWAGLHNRYFLMALIPRETDGAPRAFAVGRARLDGAGLVPAVTSEKELHFYPRLELYGPPMALEPGDRVGLSYTLFAGPKERQILKATPERLDAVLFYDSYDWMRALCLLMMTLLRGFHGLMNSWGMAIIFLVILVRLVTFPLTQIGLKHQARMMAQQAKLKPFLDKLNEKYKNDPAKRNQEMMKLYREHNVNPFGMFKGCLWMIVQLPVFFALYRLLSQSFDLRGASFLWIEDLSQPDRLFPLGFTLPLIGESHFNLLPILTAVTQFVVSKLSFNPASFSDPSQAAIQQQMLYMMPILILAMTYAFPSGLVLYWFVSNVWQLFQQQFVNKKILRPPQPAEAT